MSDLPLSNSARSRTVRALELCLSPVLTANWIILVKSLEFGEASVNWVASRSLLFI